MNEITVCVGLGGQEWYVVLIFYCCITGYNKLQWLLTTPIYQLSVLYAKVQAWCGQAFCSGSHKSKIKVLAGLYSYLGLGGLIKAHLVVAEFNSSWLQYHGPGFRACSQLGAALRFQRLPALPCHVWPLSSKPATENFPSFKSLLCFESLLSFISDLYTQI